MGVRDDSEGVGLDDDTYAVAAAVATGAVAITGTLGDEVYRLLDQSTPTQSPGIDGGFPAQFVDACRRARPRCGLDPPELQFRLPGLGPGLLPLLPVDDPVLEDRAFTSTEVVYGVTGTDVTKLPEYGVSP